CELTQARATTIHMQATPYCVRLKRASQWLFAYLEDALVCECAAAPAAAAAAAAATADTDAAFAALPLRRNAHAEPPVGAIAAVHPANRLAAHTATKAYAPLMFKCTI